MHFNFTTQKVVHNMRSIGWWDGIKSSLFHSWVISIHMTRLFMRNIHATHRVVIAYLEGF